MLGWAVFFHTWWMVLLASCAYALYYERIMFAEEAFLRQRFGDTFECWAVATPAIIPRLKGWRQPVLAFSWRNVLRREYTGFFVIIATFCLLDITGDSIAEGRLHADMDVVLLFFIGTMVYLTLRTLKKRTNLLDVPGR